MDLIKPTIRRCLARIAGVLVAAGLPTTLPLTAAPALDPKADGAQTVVVYNRQMPESQALAEYYATARGVPADQVLGFELPVVESMTRSEIRELLETPLLNALLDRGLFTAPEVQPKKSNDHEVSPWLLAAKVRYLTLCYGVPLKIARDPALIESGQNRLPEQLRRNEAAVDSELALLPANLRSLPLT